MAARSRSNFVMLSPVPNRNRSSTSGRPTYRPIRTARSATTAGALSTIRFMPASATGGELMLIPLPNLIARQRLPRFLVDERSSRRDLLPGVAPLAAREHIGHRINPDRRALSHRCLRSRAYKRRHRHHRQHDSCSMTIPASMTDRTLILREYLPDSACRGQGFFYDGDWARTCHCPFAGDSARFSAGSVERCSHKETVNKLLRSIHRTQLYL